MYADRRGRRDDGSAALVTQDAQVLELTGERTRVGTLLADVVRHRSLLVLLARHDYRARYRSASLGLVWSVVLPLVQGVVIAVVFGHLVGGGNAGSYIPYVIAGMAAWNFVQQSTIAASTTIVDSGAIAGRLYFPRLLLPAIPPTANLPGLVISLVIAGGISVATGNSVHLTVLLLPALVLMAWALVVTVGAVASMIHVYSRDVRYIIQALMLILFYAAPIIYGLSSAGGRRALPDSLRPFVLANPATGIVQFARYTLTGTADYLGVALACTGAWIVVLAVVTVITYARFERVSVDRL